MSKKSFKGLGETAASQFISGSHNIEHETHGTHENAESKKGRPKQAGEYYRFNLKLKKEYKKYLEEAAWQSRKTITQYINDLVKADMDKIKN